MTNKQRSNTKGHRPQRTQAELAKRWATTERTIRTWGKAGAPLHGTEAQMLNWLAAQRQLPDGTRRKVAPMRAEKEATRLVHKIESDPVGAVGALERLGKLERDLYHRSQEAKRRGDPVEETRLTTLYNRVSNTLRATTLAFERFRLESGELVPRAQVVEGMLMFGICCKLAAAQHATEASAGCGPATPEARQRLIALITNAMIDGVATAAAGFQHKLPAWIIAAFTRGMSGLYDVEKAAADRAEQLASLAGLTMPKNIYTPRPGWPTDWSWHRGLWYAKRAGMEFDEAWTKYGHLPRRAEVPELEPQYSAEELAKIEKYTEQTRRERAALAEKKPEAPATPTA